MNDHKVLIWHYSTRSERWYDATDSVIWYTEDENAWRVKFSSNDKFVHVSFRNMSVYENPKKIDFVELYYKGSPCFKVKELLCFDGKAYKIFYESGYTCAAFPCDIKIVKDTLKDSPQASGVMAYYRRVVQETARTEDDQYLLQQFDDINCVSDESVLAMYLKGRFGNSGFRTSYPRIAPFGINLSQSEALETMFSNRISIVEGPPGTGKTQTILNFIANAVVNHLSVAVVSNNNSATDNVYEKLDKYGYSFIAAPLGNRDNVDAFFEEYDTKVPFFKPESVDVRALRTIYQELPNYFKIENEKKKLIEHLDALELEHNHFQSDYRDFDFDTFKFKPESVKSSNVLDAIARFKESNKKLSIWSKFVLRRRLKLDRSFFLLNNETCIVLLNELYYLTKIKEVKSKISELDKRMENQSFSEKITTFTNLSKTYFENTLSSAFKNNTRGMYERENYKRQFSEFVKDYPVILSSTYSLAKCSRKGFLFDYLIVDESSQVNMASAILSMMVAKNIIVVGDIKQLPQIDDDTFKARNEQLLKMFSIPKEYSYYGNSIMSSLLSLYGNRIPKTMLKEHYRCNPNIIGFCNERFYNNELIIYTKPKEQDYSMKVIKTVAGNFARKNPDGSGLYNQREIDEIKELLEKESLEDVGVIAPYRYHTQVVTDQFGDKVEASTIHKFQGREKKTIIFSSVINDSNEFVENDNLINVAVSRAVDKFILVTSDKVAKSNKGVLSDLINYIEYHSDFGESEEGTIKSIYDLLYEDYQVILDKFRAKHPSQDFDTENITKELLKKILADQKYNSLGFSMHVSLRDFIKYKNLDLSKDEQRFIRNPNAHADFLVYKKVSHKPVMVIEVDGVSFHEQRKEQQERDAKKNHILEQSGIKLLRLKTNESGETQRIKDALDALL